MKLKTQYLLFILLAISSFTYGQVEVTIQNMTYNSGGTISDCGTIDLESNNVVTVEFGIELKKPYSMAVGNSNLKIFTKKSSSDPEIERYNEIVQSVFWSGYQPDEFYYSSISITMNAIDFNTSDGVFFARFISSSGVPYNSCNYSIEKDEVPSFSLLPTSTTVSCDSASTSVFTVTPSNIPSGATVAYQWSVGNGWLRNGNPVSNFTTTTTSVTLVSNTYPPSNVSVTPVLNGDSYPTLTSTVSLGNFNPAYQITGVNRFCTTATYTVNNLLSGTSVTSWNVSNNNIATISSNGNQATLTAIGNGIVNITAVVTNSCGQSKVITKTNIVAGNPYFPNTEMTGADEVVEDQIMRYSVPVANGATSYQWSFNYLGSGNPPIPSSNWQILNGQGSRSISVKIGNKSNLVVVICRAMNSCGNTIKYKDVRVTRIDDNCVGDNPCYGTTRVSSNPMKAGVSTNTIEYLPNPNDKNAKARTENYTLEVFNQFNVKVYSKKQNNPVFNLNNLNRGFYVVKLITDKGHVLTEKILME